MSDHDLAAIADYLEKFPVDWWIAGGWAIDLACPAPVRAHKDVDVLVRDDQCELLFDYLAPFAPWIEHPHTGERRRWRRTDRLVAGPDAIVLDDVPGLQLLIGRFEDDEWIFPRGSGRIRQNVQRLSRVGRNGLPIQSADAVLLFKSREDRPVNSTDFHAVLPHLTGTQRDWLSKAIAHRIPGHPWLHLLEEPPDGPQGPSLQ